MSIKIVHKNKKAYFNYEILESIEAGIVLSGAEVKATKNGQINMGDSFVKIEGNEAWLWNANISKYKFSDDDKYDPTKRRKLLLKRKEIDSLTSKVKQGGLTLVPTMAYLARGRVKIEVSLARGKKQHDKKIKLKELQEKRDLHREKRKHLSRY
jgi:SsrA-binding protein